MTEYKITQNNLPPTHPGAILREDILPELGISKSELARSIHISRQTLYRILDESEPVRVATAMKLGKFLGNGPRLWLNLQSAYDIWQANQSMKKELDEISTIAV